jgi:hypothetical protein
MPVFRREQSPFFSETEQKAMISDRRKLIGFGAGFAAVAGLYAVVIRPWHLRWGATDDEASMTLPGDEFVPEPDLDATHAITINAPVAAVWPWLVQIGQNRGGFYSYEWLENLVGCQMKNADRVIPEFQDLKVGDEIWLHPKAPPLKVLSVEKERHIVLEKCWTFVLREIDDHTTLIIRGRGNFAQPDLGNPLLNFIYWRLIFEPAHFIMERRMMMNLKEFVEADEG